MRGRRASIAVLAAGLVLAACVHALPASAGTTGLTLHEVGSFDRPDYVDHAPGFGKLLFVVQQPGKIAVLRKGHRVHRPFLDIHGRVSQDGGERGLLSVAFPPNYRQSRRFYVYYTNRHGNNEIDEFKRRRHAPAIAAASSRRRVLLIPHPGEPNHNGGQLEFGPDGYLYAGTGDGGGCGDPAENAQNTGSLLGKLLRIDPRKDGRRNHRSPSGNPFHGRAGLDEIYAYGFRNPWRFSFDRKTRTLAIGDVGQNDWEEVDYETVAGAKGANFGWDALEGTHPFTNNYAVCGDTPPPTPIPASHADPIFEYSHAAGCAIVGGYVVRDPALTSLDGRYLYSDNCSGDIRSLVPHLGGATDDRSTGLNVSGATSFGEGVKGRIYITSLGGKVYRLKAD